MRFRQNTLEFLSLCGALVFFALFFYQTTNNLYRIDGAFVDFSLAGWAAMLALWGAGIWLYFKQHKAGVLIFAVQAAVVCYAFDCWRLFIYATNLAMKPYILGIVAAEAAVFLIAACGRYKPAALNALAAGLIIFFGYYIMYPLLLPLPMTMAIAMLLMLIYPLARGTAKARKAAIGVLAVSLLAFAGLMFRFWLNAPGIHFYERGVAKPAEKVKVSVVVPIYNVEKYLEQCLDSLRKQTLKDIEIICVNDGSTDKSGEILAEYAAHDKRFKVITQENQYVGAARNRGIEAARGEYIGFMDSDDFVSPDYFEDLYNAAKKYNTDVAIAEQVYTIDQEPFIWEKFLNTFKKGLSRRQTLSFFLHDKTLLEAFNLYEIVYGSYVWDKIYSRKLLNNHKLRFSPYRSVYEDNYFSIPAVMYSGRVAVAHNGQYYYSRINNGMSTQTEHSPKDQAAETFADLYNLINNADMPSDEKDKWLAVADMYRTHWMTEYYFLLSPENQEIWRERWQKYFPYDDIDKAIDDWNGKIIISDGK